MQWSLSRRLVIIFIALVIVSLPVIYRLYRVQSSRVETCHDGALNGDESGIDCGGSCLSMCSESALPLVTLWTIPVRVTDTVYHVVARVENQNRFAARTLSYRFTLYDTKNILVAERSGTTVVPPSQSFTISEFGIPVGSRVPYVAFVEFEPIDTWERVNTRFAGQIVAFSNVRWEQISTGTRLTVRATNKETVPIDDARATALAFDATDTVVAVSETKVPVLGPAESKDISFTWPDTINPVRTEIVAVVDPFGNSSLPPVSEPRIHE
jgi:hypothetical protein